MLAAGAADGNGHVAAVVRDETGQPVGQKFLDVAVHAFDGRVGVEKFDHGPVLARQRTQRRVVKRIGQAANIEYEVRVQRNAVLVAERLEEERQARIVRFDEVLDPCPQRVGIQIARVDMVGLRADFGEQDALARDAFDHRQVAAAERMAAARFRKALEQRLGLGLEEDDPHGHAARLELA